MANLRSPYLALAFLTACSFDASGMGEGGSASGSGSATTGAGSSGGTSAGGTSQGGTSQGSASASGGTSSTSGGSGASGTSTSGGATTGGTSSGGSTTGGATTGGMSGGGSTTGGGGTSTGATTGGPVCPMPLPPTTTSLWADEGVLTAPMMLAMSDVLPGKPMYAFSEVKDQGVIEWSFDVECAGDYYFWGLVWDGKAGTHTKDPDSFFFSVDDSQEVEWNYGCTSGAEDWDDGVWGWSQVEDSGSGCNGAPIIYATLDPGPHKVRVRNREKNEGEAVAAIALMLVTSDPNLDPYTVYSP